MASSTSLRRRLDTMGLRLQARMDASWADRSLPWVLAGVLFATLLAMSLALVRQLDGGSGLAVWMQAAWRLRTGHAMTSSLAAGTNPVWEQWAFAAYPLLWLTRWIPTTELLAGTQAFALAITVVPIWRLARSVFDLRVGSTIAVVMAYALAPILHAVNLSLFHPEVIAIPAFAWAVLFRRQEKWFAYSLCVAVMLSARADLGITVAALGIVVLLDGDRLAGILTILVGAGWTAAAIVVLDPRPATGPLTAGQAFAAEGIAPLVEARRLVVDPTAVIGHLTSQQTVLVVIVMFGPLLFLGLAAPRTLILAAPSLVLGLAAGRSVERVSEAGVGHRGLTGGTAVAQVSVALVPITIAGLVALSRIGLRSVTHVNVDHRLVGAIVAASMLLFVQYTPSSPYQLPWDWGGRDPTDRARLAAADEVAGTLSLTVSPQISALVADRNRVVETWISPPAVVLTWRPVTEAIVLDTTATGEFGTSLWTSFEVAAVRDHLTDLGYTQVSSDDGILVFVR